MANDFDNDFLEYMCFIITEAITTGKIESVGLPVEFILILQTQQPIRPHPSQDYYNS